MGGKAFTRYYRDPQFRAGVDEQFAMADAVTRPGVCITYAIHDPTRPDHIDGRAEGLVIYVGQTKEFRNGSARECVTLALRSGDRATESTVQVMRSWREEECLASLSWRKPIASWTR